MPSDFELSTDRGIATENGRYGTVDGDAFVRQHITLAVLDVLAGAQYGRRTAELIEDVTVALRQRLTNHTQVETIQRITIDRDAPPRVLRGEIVTDAVTVPLDERL
ncbi:hypothetical protein DJ71_02335 [Halorubrum sp. E3]|nr:hypothetical protein DJ71_02335 [Halorubrum sp. E3]